MATSPYTVLLLPIKLMAHNSLRDVTRIPRLLFNLEFGMKPLSLLVRAHRLPKLGLKCLDFIFLLWHTTSQLTITSQKMLHLLVIQRFGEQDKVLVLLTVALPTTHPPQQALLGQMETLRLVLAV